MREGERTLKLHQTQHNKSTGDYRDCVRYFSDQLLGWRAQCHEELDAFPTTEFRSALCEGYQVLMELYLPKKDDIRQTNVLNVKRQNQVINLIEVGRVVGNPQSNYLTELWRTSAHIKFTSFNFALIFDSVSADWIRSGTLFNHQRVTDVLTNCRERHGQVRMLPLLVSVLLWAADFPHSARKCPLQYSSRQNLTTPTSQFGSQQPTPQPPVPQPAVPACSLCRQGSSGTHPELNILPSQPPGPGAGEGQIKACWAPSFFPSLTSNQPHSRVVSCQASACP